jgi:hypothetical protein
MIKPSSHLTKSVLLQIINENLLPKYLYRGQKQFEATTVAALEQIFIDEDFSCYHKLSNARIEELSVSFEETTERMKKWFMNKVVRTKKPYHPVKSKVMYKGPSLQESQQAEAEVTP